MKSMKHGRHISSAEITNISEHGFWVFLGESEYFLPFEKFPWFKEAKISEITDLEVLHGRHLHWPKLDVDLSIDIIERPDDFGLVAK